MKAFYNENEPYAVEWLKNLSRENLIAPGEVDSRSIVDVRPKDLEGHHQIHFFAGIGGWSYALRLAGWPDDVPVWTGSCPCQPFSTSGRKRGFKDERHLWPTWFKLIRKCRPEIVFGEQVASPDGLRWLDLVFDDLEGAGYAVGASDLCAAGVGAPHIRQRLYFVAVSREQRREGKCVHLRAGKPRSSVVEVARSSKARELGYASSSGSRRDASPVGQRPEERFGAVRYEGATASETGATAGFWEESEWWLCRDGKARSTESSPQQMADGFSESLGRLRPGTAEAITKEIIDAEITDTAAREALRDLWRIYAAKADERKTGRCRSLQEAPVLLAFLRELSREEWHLIDHLPSACQQNIEAGLRALRGSASSVARTSRGRRSEQQHTKESSDALSIVSQAIAHAIEKNWTIPFPLDFGAHSRVGRLKSYGNAIVPEQAALFIRAVAPLIGTIWRIQTNQE